VPGSIHSTVSIQVTISRSQSWTYKEIHHRPHAVYISSLFLLYYLGPEIMPILSTTMSPVCTRVSDLWWNLIHIYWLTTQPRDSLLQISIMFSEFLQAVSRYFFPTSSTTLIHYFIRQKNMDSPFSSAQTYSVQLDPKMNRSWTKLWTLECYIEILTPGTSKYAIILK
jgi:hypothetical protein